MYGLDVCSVCFADKHSFDFIQTRILMKIFKTKSLDIVTQCRLMFNLRTISELVCQRKQRFLEGFMKLDDNFVCNALYAVAELEYGN